MTANTKTPIVVIAGSGSSLAPNRGGIDLIFGAPDSELLPGRDIVQDWSAAFEGELDVAIDSVPPRIETIPVKLMKIKNTTVVALLSKSEIGRLGAANAMVAIHVNDLRNANGFTVHMKQRGSTNIRDVMIGVLGAALNNRCVK